ncbi:restriction endonuclease subunit S [Streptococcus halichoeri]|uniref:restriction endonuclease subunit S n=1 Tax=Streptococcus halichoeri TaxID=254785 RepID=UPI00135B0DBB|nr:restriction endonuclease subunit S [Streptococcus halichoeri]
MKLTKLGKYLETYDERNHDRLDTTHVVGISTSKEFIETKAKLDGVSLKSYKVVPPKYFAYVADTSRRGEKISLSYNSSEDEYLVSSISTVFKVKEPELLSSDFLFMYFNRPEFDRFSRYNSWGSARETFSWDDMCDIEIDLPPIDIQEKYVAIYKAMLANQKAYENGLEDLKLVCDATIQELQKSASKISIGTFIELYDERNKDNANLAFKGLSMNNYFIDSIANSHGLDFTKYKIVFPKTFGAVLMKVGRDKKITIAQNNSNENYMISSAYFTFRANNKIDEDYLMMVMSTTDFDLRCWFNSDSSIRGSLEWDRFCEVEIPVASYELQVNLSKIYQTYLSRKEINERLKKQIKDICPILIAGAIKEANANA